jgi:hypothetical protein
VTRSQVVVREMEAPPHFLHRVRCLRMHGGASFGPAAGAPCHRLLGHEAMPDSKVVRPGLSVPSYLRRRATSLDGGAAWTLFFAP